jgi:hypothetical protein
MTLFGLAPATFLLGALVLTAALGLLHLLRVRLRSVQVDTLLFFRLAGALQKPRVLPGRPARWLAFALALLVALAAWLAMAEPRSGLAGASRFVVVEPDLRDGDARLEQARSLAAAGLGPRGAIVASTLPPTLLLAAGEPANALDARAGALRTAASALGERAAMQALGDRRTASDEVVWLGAQPPAVAEFPVVHEPVARAPVGALRGLRWQRDAGAGATLVLQWDGSEVPVELRAGAVVLATAVTTAGTGEVRLGPIDPPEAGAELRCTIGGADAFVVPWPDLTPVRVHLEGSLPVDLAVALTALLEADATLAAAPDTTAEVIVGVADAPGDARPRLVLSAGRGDGPRFAVNTLAAPVRCSLRDRQPRDAAELPPLAGARVWIADEVRGGALAAATVADGQRRVWIVDWLLRPRTHADVPLLLIESLRALGGRDAVPLRIAGQALAVPAVFPVASTRGALLPVDGVLPMHSAQQPALTVPVPSTALPMTHPTLAAIGGDGSWVPWLLLLLVLLLAVDAMLFHRGRLP